MKRRRESLRDERVQGSKPLRGIAWSFLPLKVKRQTSRNLNEEEGEEEDFASKWLLRLKSPPPFFFQTFSFRPKKKKKKKEISSNQRNLIRDLNFNKLGRGERWECGAKVRFDTENRSGSRAVCENQPAAVDTGGRERWWGRIDERESSWKSNLCMGWPWLKGWLKISYDRRAKFRSSFFFFFLDVRIWYYLSFRLARIDTCVLILNGVKLCQLTRSLRLSSEEMWDNYFCLIFRCSIRLNKY